MRESRISLGEPETCFETSVHEPKRRAIHAWVFNYVVGDGPGRGRSVRWGRKKLRQTGPGPGLHGGLADIAGSDRPSSD
jgi:hypothetical protein